MNEIKMSEGLTEEDEKQWLRDGALIDAGRTLQKIDDNSIKKELETSWLEATGVLIAFTWLMGIIVISIYEAIIIYGLDKALEDFIWIVVELFITAFTFGQFFCRWLLVPLFVGLPVTFLVIAVLASIIAIVSPSTEEKEKEKE